MSWLDRLSLRPRRRRREVDAEVEAHLEMRVHQLTETGMDEAAARQEALRRFGNLDTARQRLYASAKRRDQRLRREPAAAALSVATFALGIGLTTATFSVVDHALLRPLPFSEPEELVRLHSVASDGASFPWVSATNWLDWSEQSRTLASSAIYSVFGTATVVTTDDAFTVPAKSVSGRFFEVLRTPMAAGRPLTPDEVRDGAAVAVVSEAFWRRVLSADPELAATVSISGRPTRVVGVVQAGFEFPAETQVWLPARYQRRGGASRNNINWLTVARLAPGTDIGAARAELSVIADGIRNSDPAGIYSYGVGVFSLKEEIVGDSQQTLLLAMGCVLAVLLEIGRASCRERV